MFEHKEGCQVQSKFPSELQLTEQGPKISRTVKDIGIFFLRLFEILYSSASKRFNSQYISALHGQYTQNHVLTNLLTELKKEQGLYHYTNGGDQYGF